MRYAAVTLLLTATLIPVPTVTAQEQAIGVLIIPRVDITTPITVAPLVTIDGLRQNAVPAHNAGWLDGSTWIYEDWGRVVLAGHTPGIFARLNELQLGDLIVVVGLEGAVRYSVVNIETDSRWNGALRPPTTPPTLQLITCLFDGSEDRLIIEAIRIE
jgi:LPXTG-site transpeptidase (sortase) family protein